MGQTANMKSIVFAALLVVAACRPQDDVDVYVVREEAHPIDGFNFRNVFELDNGVAQSMVGSAAAAGVATVNWIADALGFRAESPLLPVAPVNPHPIPAHAQELINFANAQLAAGLIWNQAANAWV